MEPPNSSEESVNEVSLETPSARQRSGSARSIASPTGSGHKKTLSGNLLSKFPWLKHQPQSPDKETLEDNTFPPLPGNEDPPPSPRHPAVENVISQNQIRKRKSSLRKTALLGTGKLRLDRRFSNPEAQKKSPTRTERKGSQKSPNRFAFELPDANSSSESNPQDPDRTAFPTLQTADVPKTSLDGESGTASPITSPTGTYASTTDDDEGITLPASLDGALFSPAIKSASSSPPSSESSGPVQISPMRRHSSVKTKSPLAASQISEFVDIDQDWDYSETEWWGWVILIVTWIVFVVGMGSCFEVWSWAWDVGQTPYAPPELEDDPTLPIVGYYPALIILTAVMSWVWVVVAWVGLKYFKHAKIQSEDT